MLLAKNISKKFGGVIALNNVNLELHPGKVNAIIGENGAGKSTLMKIFSGVYTHYEGTVFFNDQPVAFKSTRDAEKAGIAIIHQELNLVPHLTIAENIFLGRELINAFGVIKVALMNKLSTQLLTKLNLNISPSTKIAALKVGQQQLVEIAKALYANAAVIIMDEPTSAISDKEVDNLFSIIKELKKDNKTIVYISHKLNELFAIADRFIVLRDGATVDDGNMIDVDQDTLIHKMTGRTLNVVHRKDKTNLSAELLTVNNICQRHPQFKNKYLLNNISFKLFKGEVLGVYGLMGSGRTELMESIFGLHPLTSTGEIYVNGTFKKISCPADAIKAGIALVPEDRKLQGLILMQSIRTNMSITILNKLEKWGFLVNTTAEKKLCDNYIKELSIKSASCNVLAKNLSGGNQQKVVLAKWLATHPSILLLDEPTRGIDIHAKTQIYHLIKQLANEGIGIIIVSSELPEILAVSDRVMVLADGSISTTISIEEATETSILKHAIQKQ